jgi:hypothetical protein
MPCKVKNSASGKEDNKDRPPVCDQKITLGERYAPLLPEKNSSRGK